MAQPLRVGLIGYGYWGPNLARNLMASSTTELVAISDLSETRRKSAATLYPQVAMSADARSLLALKSVQAVVVATPLKTHFTLAKAALLAGKHVLVEKPLATSAAGCDELIALAADRGLTLMVDHTFVFTGAVEKVKEIVDSGELGKIFYFDSVRINLGLFRPDFDVVWDLAPHDLSIFDYAIGSEPQWVSAITAAHYDGHQANLAYLTIGYPDQLTAHMHLNWVAPVKTRRITIAGAKRMLVYDDTQPAERVKIYHSRVDVDELDAETTYRMNIQYRTGDVWAPELSPVEALRAVVEEFAASIAENRASRTDGHAGSRVVRLLEAAQASAQNQGARIQL